MKSLEVGGIMMHKLVETPSFPSAFLNILLNGNGFKNLRSVGHSFLCLLVMCQQNAHGPFC